MKKKMKKLVLGSLAVGGFAALYMVTRRKDTASIVLKENLTEGYLWMYTLEPDGIVEEYSTNYVPAFGEEETGDSYGEHKWTFAPLKAGEAKIRFAYVRPWEKETPAAAEATYQFTVDDNRKLSIELLDCTPTFNDYVISVR